MVKRIRIRTSAEIEVDGCACSRDCHFLNPNEPYCFLFKTELFLAREKEGGPMILARCESCVVGVEIEETGAPVSGQEKPFTEVKEGRRRLDRGEIKALMDQGKRPCEIAREIGRNYISVIRVMKELKGKEAAV